MKRFIITCFCSLIAFVLFLWIALFFPTTQKWAKEQLESYASKKFGYQVKIGSFEGFPPFIFSFKDVEFLDKKSGAKVASIRTTRMVPAWFDIVLGRISLFHLQLDTVSLHQFEGKERNKPLTLSSFLPNRKISVYSFSCTHLSLTPESKELYNTKGSLFWNSKSEYLTTSIEVEQAGEKKNESSVTVELDISKKQIAAKVQGKLSRLETFFPKVPLEQLDVQAEFKSRHTQVLEKIWGHTQEAKKTTDEPYFRGKTSAFLIGNQKLQKLYPELYSLSVSSTFELSSDSIFSFELQPIKAHRTNAKPLPITSNLFGHIQHKQEAYHIAVKGKTLSAFDVQLTDAELVATCKKQNQIWSGTFAAKGLLQERLELLFETSWATDGKKVASFNDAKIRLGSSAVQGGLNCFFSPFLLKGKLEGQTEDVTPIAQLFRKNMSGKATVSASFDVDSVQEAVQEAEHMQTMKVALNFTDIEAPTFGFEKASVEVEGSGQLSKPHLKVTCSAQNGAWKHIEVERASLFTSFDLAQEQASFPFDFQSRGTVDKGPFVLNVTGAISDSGLYTKDLFFSLDKKEAHLEKPFSFQCNKDAITLSPVDITWENGGKLLCEATINADAVQGNLQAHEVPLDLMHLVFPKSFVSGIVSLEGSLTGTKSEPSLQLDLKTDSMVIGTHKQDFLLPLEVVLNLGIDSKNARLSGKIKTNDNQKPLILELCLPIHFQKDLKIVFPKEEKIAGSLKGLCEISPFLAPFLDEDELVEGAINFDLGLAGTALKPDLMGSFSWKQGRLDILKTGGMFSQICAYGMAQGDCLIIESFVASDEKNGAIFAKGKIELNPALNFPFALQIDASCMDIVKRDFAQVSATGKAEVIGNFQKAKLSGRLLADKARLNLTSDFSSDVPTLDFIYINHPDPDLLALKNNFVLTLDLDVALPNTGTISGRGLESNWQGDLKILGTTDTPLIHGKITSTSGTFSFANKEFKFTEGSIDVAGDIFSQSRLNILAVADLNDIRAQLFLRGPLEKPRLSLQSIPLLSEKEILSQILFNKPITEVSPVQGLQLAQVLMSMNGKASKYNVIEKFKNIIGIDHFDVNREVSEDPADPNDAVEVQIGKYLSKDVFVKLSKDVASAVNRVAIEANLHKNVSVQAEVGDDQEGQMSLMWKYDY